MQENKIENRNYLSPTGFKLSLYRSPGVAFFCNQANIPSINLGIAEQPTYLRNIPIPGDKIDFGDLTIRFLVDEDLKNYMEIQKWIRGLGYPESLDQFSNLEKNFKTFGILNESGDNTRSDGTLQVLNNNMLPSFQIFFNDLFPYDLSTLTFDATQTDQEYFTADVSFKYTIYNITDLEGNNL
jgi:hypothetical protein